MVPKATYLYSQERVPHRWHVLRMLRAMRLGHPFIHLWDMSTLTYLEGVPQAVHYFGFLQRNGYIAPCAREGLLSHYYTLTTAGLDLLEQGERWWHSLRWPQRYCVMWAG